MRIKNRLLLTHGLLVLLSLLIIFINITEYKGMESDSFAINRAGKLRSLSYNMGLITSQIGGNGYGADLGYLYEKLELKIEEYEIVLESLNEMQKKIDYKEMEKDIGRITNKWRDTFKPLYMRLLTGEDVTELCKVLNEEIDAYVDEIDAMVASYSKHSKGKIDFALKQNAVLVIVIVLITIYSFYINNRRISKPIDTLMQEIKGLDLIDEEVAGSLEEISKDEISEMSRYFNEMMYDQLTRAYTRGTGLAKLRSIIQQNRRFTLLSLCFIDINGLKMVNDLLGHRYGDELITTVVDCVKKEIRAEDFVIRMGGDEFLIVLKDSDGETAEKVWQRIETKYQEINEKEDRPYIVSVSHGIAEYDSLKRVCLEELIKVADGRMYEEKQYIKEELKIQIIKGEEATNYISDRNE
ncbi:MAG: diguanylate cyclase domain-containing protein [Anaerovoracaceae bacterium]|jgi:diguanylate cyclase (GGDEF)-like protein